MSHGWAGLSRYEKAALALMVGTLVVVTNLGANVAIWALPLMFPGFWVLIVQAQRMLRPPGREDRR